MKITKELLREMIVESIRSGDPSKKSHSKPKPWNPGERDRNLERPVRVGGYDNPSLEAHNKLEDLANDADELWAKYGPDMEKNDRMLAKAARDLLLKFFTSDKYIW